MSYLNDSTTEPSLLRTEDLVSAGAYDGNSSSRNYEIMDALEAANKRLLDQNQRLKEHLILQKENADWRTAAVLSQILNWFEEPRVGHVGAAIQVFSQPPPSTKAVGRASTRYPPPSTRQTKAVTKTKESPSPVKQRKIASIIKSPVQKQGPSTVTDDKWETEHLTHGDVWSVKRDEHTIGKPVASSTPTSAAADKWGEKSETPWHQQFDRTAELSQWLRQKDDLPTGSIARKRSDDGAISKELFDESAVESPDEPLGKSTDDAAEKIARLSNVPDSDQIKRLVGEIGFQLDRRILSYIFNGRHMEGWPERKRFYGFTIGNIPEMIELQSMDLTTGMPNSKRKAGLTYRYKYIFHSLRPLGYKQEFHPMFTVRIVNYYGLLNGPLDETTRNQILNDPETIRKILRMIISKDEQKDVNILLDCLVQLACDDGKPLFIW